MSGLTPQNRFQPSAPSLPRFGSAGLAPMARLGARRTAEAAPAAAVSGSVKSVVGKNVAGVLGDYWHNILQDPTMFKNNALIFSTLLLVMARIYVSNRSAMKARNSEEGAFRYKEAVKTSIREMGGWTLSFVVFRAVQRLVERGLRVVFDIKKPGSLLMDTMGRLREGIRLGKEGKRVKPYRLHKSYEFDVYNPEKMKAAYEKFQLDLLYKTKASALPAEAALARMTGRIKNLYLWLPLAIGSIPAIVLSGYALERYTQKHSTEVAEAISRKLHPDKPLPTAPSAPLKRPEGGNQQAFQAFVGQVQHRRQQSW